MSKVIALHAWTLHRREGKYYIPFTHWVYLNEIVKYYDTVWLMSPTKEINELENIGYESISMFSNVKVYELPYSDSYISTIKYFRSYVSAYKKLSKEANVVYTRYPGPFGWLQMFFFKNKKRMIHYVGDPIDTIVNNPNLSSLKKAFYKVFFKPEDWLFTQAAKGAVVYTNGHHIATKLEKKRVQANPVISSTLRTEDFYYEDKVLNTDAPRIIYVGYLRKAKGVETVLKAFALLLKHKPQARLTIVGAGELDDVLRELVVNENIVNVDFTGHVDSREKLNHLFRTHDIFCFASLSEGSPRVILEAMANGLAVVSTPVGSLPTTFKDNEEIVFAEFNDTEDFCSKLILLCNSTKYESVRKLSYQKVQEFTIERFLKNIFE